MGTALVPAGAVAVICAAGGEHAASMAVVIGPIIRRVARIGFSNRLDTPISYLMRSAAKCSRQTNGGSLAPMAKIWRSCPIAGGAVGPWITGVA
jgi:hypothetical protein